MYLANLSLHDFRSYPELVLALDPGVSAFVGHNGQGKTNIVEAIAYLGTFASHRVASDLTLVRHGTPAAVIRAKAVRAGRETLVELEIVAGRANRARLNRAPSRTREVLGIVRSVVFAPEDLELVKGDPQPRRRFLDDLLVLLTPRLAGVRSEYDKILRQRGALLKTAGAARRRGASTPDLTTLDVWDGHLAAAGARLIAARIELVQRLRPQVARAYEQVSAGQGEARLGYRSALLALHDDGEATPEQEAALADVPELEQRLVAAMAQLRSKEIDRGVTLVGPHRDDLVLTLGGLPAKGYASHGESWSFALALRLACYEVLRAVDADGDPVLILDDVFAELDVRRRERLAEMVAGAEQVLVTAAVAEDVPTALHGTRFTVADGRATRD